MWFDTWSDNYRVLLVAAASYATLVVVLRLSGKRTLAKLNAFDFVVTVALGSTLATIILSADVTWAEGAIALAALAALQLVVAFTASRVPFFREVLTSGPTFLVRDGVKVSHALKGQRVAEAEIRQAVRQAGLGDLEEVAAVVLESDGTLSVIPEGKLGRGWAMEDVS